MPHKRRKIVLVIVEGPSDETALEQSFTALFDPDEIRIKVVHGDITADIGASSSNVVASVGSLVKNYASIYGLKPRDFLQVIHITDTDGVYIPDSNVIEKGDHMGRPEYTETNIVAAPESKIKERNARKKACLDKLSLTPFVWKIVPYSIYYMSCNLDHVLYDVQNSDDETKNKNAFRFATKYKDDFDGFVEYISGPTLAVAGDYKETWEYIRQDLNSLRRHTNLNLCFQKR